MFTLALLDPLPPQSQKIDRSLSSTPTAVAVGTGPAVRAAELADGLSARLRPHVASEDPVWPVGGDIGVVGGELKVEADVGHEGRKALAAAGAGPQAPLARAVDAGGPPRRVGAVGVSAGSRLDAAGAAAYGAIGLAGERGQVTGEEAGEAFDGRAWGGRYDLPGELRLVSLHVEFDGLRGGPIAGRRELRGARVAERHEVGAVVLQPSPGARDGRQFVQQGMRRVGMGGSAAKPNVE